jgi:tetratricopeptide (TPR) repeat protein
MQSQEQRMPRRLVRRLTPLFAAILLVAAPARADDLADVQQLLKSGNAAEALKRADQFLAAKPKDAQMRFLKGVALSEQNRGADAVAMFLKLTEDYPELPEPYNNLAVLYANQGQFDKARTALEMAIRTNPSYATAYENLGDVYAKLASQAYAKALQVDTTSTAAAPKLAMIRDLFGPRGKAAAAAATTAAAPATPAAPVKPPAPTAAAPATPAPAPATTVAAAPTPAPAAPAASGDPSRDIQAAVRAWADAWSRKDMDTYFAAYTGEFDGGKNRKAWQDERRARITGKRNINVGVADMVVDINGERATVRFRQNYAADALNISSRKSLEMVRVRGKWLIEKESSGS